LKRVCSEGLRRELQQLMSNYEDELRGDELRPKVLCLVHVLVKLRELGSSLSISESDPEQNSARHRILSYFRKYPLTVIDGDELLIISGIQEYARRVRELRVQFGWLIVSGLTLKEMLSENEFIIRDLIVKDVRPNQYVLMSQVQDTEAAFRWHVANEIRKSTGPVRNKLLRYLQHNVGMPVSGEELRYVSGDKTEWARRIRELRTEFGWSVITKHTGRPDLPIGTYLLESLRQSPEHDRVISDFVRGRVLRRDNYQCTACGWNKDLWDRSDPRHLELHHNSPHASGGENTEENLVTLCTLCHDQVHRSGAPSGNRTPALSTL